MKNNNIIGLTLFVGGLIVGFGVGIQNTKRKHNKIAIKELVELNKQLDVILEDLSDKKRVMGTA